MNTNILDLVDANSVTPNAGGCNCSCSNAEDEQSSKAEDSSSSDKC